MTSAQTVESLKEQIASHENQLKDLRRQLADAQLNPSQKRKQGSDDRSYQSTDPLAHDFSHGVPDGYMLEIFAALSNPDTQPSTAGRWPLNQNEYKRYGRQLIMPEIGLPGK